MRLEFDSQQELSALNIKIKNAFLFFTKGIFFVILDFQIIGKQNLASHQSSPVLVNQVCIQKKRTAGIETLIWRLLDSWSSLQKIIVQMHR